jgi:hypothetical protein
MKRTLVIIALVVTVLFLVAILLRPRDRITQASWDRIQVGMTLQEVEAILGGPGKNDEDIQVQINGIRKVWMSRSGFGVIWIQFDNEGRVHSKGFY